MQNWRQNDTLPGGTRVGHILKEELIAAGAELEYALFTRSGRRTSCVTE